jgi:hypothetical protein
LDVPVGAASHADAVGRVATRRLLVMIVPFASILHLVTSASSIALPLASNTLVFRPKSLSLASASVLPSTMVRPSAFSASQPMAFRSSSRVFFSVVTASSRRH